MTTSPRLLWVRENAIRLIEIAEIFGARSVALCGSVARGQDHDGSDIDFFVWEFDGKDSDELEQIEARSRANDLVREFRRLSPFDVDIRGIPGWCIDEAVEAQMRSDSIALSELAS